MYVHTEPISQSHCAADLTQFFEQLLRVVLPCSTNRFYFPPYLFIIYLYDVVFVIVLYFLACIVIAGFSISHAFGRMKVLSIADLILIFTCTRTHTHIHTYT